MNPEAYRERWESLRRGGADVEAVGHLARQVALSFMDRSLFNDVYESDCIDILCDMAVSPVPAGAAKAASEALFGIVVEGLCDDFEDPQTGTYNRVMSQVVGMCRRLPAGREMDSRLSGFGLTSDGDVLRRIEALRGAGPEAWEGAPPDKIVLLSRMTIGADVAVTSVLIQRLGAAFHGAEMVLVGGANLPSIFSGRPRLRFREIEYARRGGLLERFGTWHRLLDILAEEAASSAGRLMVVDPDSRLSQLGVLPVAEPACYRFFNSRTDAPGVSRMAMSELANAWADRVAGPGAHVHPAVWLPAETALRGAALAGALRGQGARRLAAVNLGVGGNPRKRLSDGFEIGLLSHLLKDPGTVVVLDMGAGQEELERSERLLTALGAAGVRTARCRFGGEPPRMQGGGGVLAVECGIGEIAAVISRCDEFIGYDSACQHIAAALGVPAYIVFAGSNNPRFVRRWRACGPGRVEVIHVDTLSRSTMFDDEDIIARVASARQAP